ncbi:hypothetical protein ACXET9_11110 [Brachybacterium sp. DNPG3]
MKELPRYWARHREVVTTSEGDRLDLTMSGCSSISVEDAQRDADERFRRIVAEGGPRRWTKDREYYPDRRQPEELLEEIRDEDGALVAALTRNRYGAVVLNTDAVLITDIDLPGEPRRTPPAGDRTPVAARPERRPGLLNRLFGGGQAANPATSRHAGEDEINSGGELFGGSLFRGDADDGFTPTRVRTTTRGIPVVDDADPDAFGLRGEGDRGAAHDRILERLGRFSATRPDLGVRVYRTRNGFRMLASGTALGPDSAGAQALMEEVGSDELYVLLCRVHDSYRARLTPKPWRVGMPPCPGAGPWMAEHRSYRQWVTQYVTASEGTAVCRLVGESGPAASPLEQRIIALHDRATHADSGLRLA